MNNIPESQNLRDLRSPSKSAWTSRAAWKWKCCSRLSIVTGRPEVAADAAKSATRRSAVPARPPDQNEHDKHMTLVEILSHAALLKLRTGIILCREGPGNDVSKTQHCLRLCYICFCCKAPRRRPRAPRAGKPSSRRASLARTTLALPAASPPEPLPLPDMLR